MWTDLLNYNGYIYCEIESHSFLLYIDQLQNQIIEFSQTEPDCGHAIYGTIAQVLTMAGASNLRLQSYECLISDKIQRKGAEELKHPCNCPILVLMGGCKCGGI